MACKTCEMNRYRYGRYEKYDFLVNDLLRELKEKKIIQRDSCIECVEKHVGQAMVLISEIPSGYPIHFLYAIGHLQEAYNESLEYPELSAYLLESRRNYQREGTIPDWEKINELINNVKKNQKK